MMNKRKILSLLLSICLLIGLLPGTALAAEPGSAAAYPVYVYGGTLQKDGAAVRPGASIPAGTVLTITLDENLFPDYTFEYWAGSDGTRVPQKSFRVLVNRMTAFYPVFTGLTGNFGEWQMLEKGALCTDGTLYVREDSATGQKEYRLRDDTHRSYIYEYLSDTQHTVRCEDCAYSQTMNHSWSDGVVAVEPTCGSTGEKVYTCSLCGAVRSETIEKETSHSYPYTPKDSDYVIITPPSGSTPGRRMLKCSVCGEPGRERDYIAAVLPDKPGTQHYTLRCTSGYSVGSGMNHARIEEHYFNENAYYYAVKRDANSRGFMLLWFDEGENSPVYIRSAAKNSDGGISATQDYGTRESNYYGILCYVDNREEFINLISRWSGIYEYDNGRSTSYFYSPVSGYRTYEKLWNENPEQFTLKSETTREGWEGPLKLYERTYGGAPYQYLVDENNVCVFANERTQTVGITYDTREDFPFTKPDREKISWYSYHVTSGTYGNVGYDGGHFGMASKDWSDEDRRVVPSNPTQGKEFSHWEKYDPRTWKWEYCTDQAIWTPSVSDVTTLRAVYKDITYHIKVNKGYYQISTGYNEWSKEKYTEGDVKYGTEIRIGYDYAQIPEGQEYAYITDLSGEHLSSFSQKVLADNEYTVYYQTRKEYFEADAENGVVKKDDQVFTGGSFPLGTVLTLTTEGDEGYLYFKGWCRVSGYGGGKGGGKSYTVISTEPTYTTTVTADWESRRITAVWRDTDEPLPGPQEPAWHNITIVNGLARAGYSGTAVSALCMPDESGILVVRDPSLKREVESWVLTDADGDSTALATKPYQEFGNDFYIPGAGGKEPESGGLPANLLITGVLKQYCVHTCSVCGGCTLKSEDAFCGVKRCSCDETAAEPLPTAPPETPPTVILNGVIGAVTAVVLQVEDIETNKNNPYVSYVLQAVEGYELDAIYDISLKDEDGQKFILKDGETATITLTVGKANAQLIDEGKIVLIHITDTDRIIYGKEETNGQKTFDAVDTANGTVTFTTSSCSPFVLAHTDGVTVKGKVASCNANNSFTVTLYEADTETVVKTQTVFGNGDIGKPEQEFSISNVAAGTYDIVIQKDAHLTYTLKNVAVGSADIDLTIHTNPAISTITLLAGNMNSDNSINADDLNVVWNAANFNRPVGEARDKWTDINGDGNVNADDLNILWNAVNFNKSANNCIFIF